jgi:uncharacterized protein YndB with AHSA1/START domain
MKWVLIGIGVLVGLILLVTIIGAMLPRDHVASMQVVVPASRDAVWAAVTDVASYPTWRTDVKKVGVLSQPPAPLSWREEGSQGGMTLTAETFEPPRRLIARIQDQDLPYGGAWEYVLEPDAGNADRTRVTITERGFVSNPIFRFVSRFVLGHHSTIDAYLKALGRKFGGDLTPQRV